ncbi:hypothetical protein J3A83DRAFT_4457437 [Scleroderma citrinum]
MGQARVEQASQSHDYEEQIQAAISGVANGQYKSYRIAAKAEGVVQQTLMNQANGLHETRGKAFPKLQLLTPVQEETLVDCATPLHFTNLCAQAAQNWPQHFLKHNPCLVLVKSRGLDSKRAQNFNRTALEEKYDGIPPEHHWNMDKKGCQMGGGRQEDKDHYCLHSTAMPPTFILKDGPLADHSDVEGIAVNYICETWFQETFVPNALAFAYKYGIIILAFPSKMTHKPQPLDVGVFSSLQQKIHES